MKPNKCKCAEFVKPFSILVLFRCEEKGQEKKRKKKKKKKGRTKKVLNCCHKFGLPVRMQAEYTTTFSIHNVGVRTLVCMEMKHMEWNMFLKKIRFISFWHHICRLVGILTLIYMVLVVLYYLALPHRKATNVLSFTTFLPVNHWKANLKKWMNQSLWCKLEGNVHVIPYFVTV